MGELYHALLEGSPALAGIDLHFGFQSGRFCRFPRTRGDRPAAQTLTFALTVVPPHSRG